MTETAERFSIELPDFDDVQEVEGYKERLEGNLDVHGVKKLYRLSALYITLQHRMDKVWRDMERATMVVNGVRTPLQAAKDRARGYKRTARTFYTAMDDVSLHGHAQWAHMNTTHMTVEQIIGALVDRYVHDAMKEATNAND